jgi:hypothetical protein
MQDLFRRMFMASQGGVAWADGPDQGKAFLFNKQIDKLVRSLGKIQYRHVEAGNVSRWDISILGGLLSGMDWKIDLTEYALQIAAVSTIKIVRNGISHLPGNKVDKVSYDQWSKLLKTGLSAFGLDADEIEAVATSGALRFFRTTALIILMYFNVVINGRCFYDLI